MSFHRVGSLTTILNNVDWGNRVAIDWDLYIGQELRAMGTPSCDSGKCGHLHYWCLSHPILLQRESPSTFLVPLNFFIAQGAECVIVQYRTSPPHSASPPPPPVFYFQQQQQQADVLGSSGNSCPRQWKLYKTCFCSSSHIKLQFLIAFQGKMAFLKQKTKSIFVSQKVLEVDDRCRTLWGRPVSSTSRDLMLENPPLSQERSVESSLPSVHPCPTSGNWLVLACTSLLRYSAGSSVKIYLFNFNESGGNPWCWIWVKAPKKARKKKQTHLLSSSCYCYFGLNFIHKQSQNQN